MFFVRITPLLVLSYSIAHFTWPSFRTLSLLVPIYKLLLTSFNTKIPNHMRFSKVSQPFLRALSYAFPSMGDYNLKSF
jgi:hypothetical protein